MSTEIDRGVQDYLGHLAVERGLADNTLKSYRRDLRRYLAHLSVAGRQAPGEITDQDILDFQAALRTGDPDHPALGSASVARHVVTVRGLHKFWLREGVVDADVASGVKPPRPAQRLPKALPIDDIIKILDAAAAPGTALAKRDAALLEFLYATGARISEAVGLDVDDIDAEQESVLLRGKGGKQRMVPIHQRAITTIDDYLTAARPGLMSQKSPSAAVFLNSRGGRLSRQSAWSVLVKAADAAGVRADVSPHSLRHSIATHLLDAGWDVRMVQELLGHASVTTTQIYTLVTVDKLREVYATAHPRSQH